MNVMTTNPNPPIPGEKTTTVPLSINAQLDQQEMPVNIPIKASSMFSERFTIPLDIITISNATPVGTNIYTFHSETPLLGRPIYRGNTQFIPKDLFLAYFSKKVRCEYKLIFTAIKVADARFALDFVYNYSDRNPSGYGIDTLANHNNHRIFDNQNSKHTENVPLFYASQEMQTDVMPYSTAAADLYLPAGTIPTTRLDVFVAMPYAPSLMQPDSISIIVELEVDVTMMEGFAAKGFNIANTPFITARTRPFFLNPIP